MAGVRDVSQRAEGYGSARLGGVAWRTPQRSRGMGGLVCGCGFAWTGGWAALEHSGGRAGGWGRDSLAGGNVFPGVGASGEVSGAAALSRSGGRGREIYVSLCDNNKGVRPL